MSETVTSALARNLSEVERLRDAPEEPFGYGTDISCAEDFQPDARDVDGFSTQAIGEAIYRRLTTPRGSNPDDEDYGLDVAAYLNRPTTTLELRGLAERVRLEILKDDRVSSSTVVMTPNQDGSAFRLQISVRPFDVDLGTFSLTLALTDGAALLEEIRADG